jgi:hypothetical protein
MRLRLMLTFSIALSLAATSLAAAEDAGGEDDASESAAGADAASFDGASASANAAAVIACDGDLCDTLQGRPTCAVAERSIGSVSAPTGWLVGAAAALSLCLARRGNRGASRPFPGGWRAMVRPTVAASVDASQRPPSLVTRR